ncbi:MAG: hypothetical protein HFH45_03600, partial [Bacilli bacterium]|nr:hypothetical protein [Bacilli bacterium]
MKIEEGMYVRTKYGLIRKLDKITKDIYSFQDRLCFKEDIDNFIKEARFSYDIIDLIKVGDYVNGQEVIALRKNISERDIHPSSKDCNIFIQYTIADG